MCRRARSGCHCWVAAIRLGLLVVSVVNRSLHSLAALLSIPASSGHDTAGLRTMYVSPSPLFLLLFFKNIVFRLCRTSLGVTLCSSRPPQTKRLRIGPAGSSASCGRGGRRGETRGSREEERRGREEEVQASPPGHPSSRKAGQNPVGHRRMARCVLLRVLQCDVLCLFSLLNPHTSPSWIVCLIYDFERLCKYDRPVHCGRVSVAVRLSIYMCLRVCVGASVCAHARLCVCVCGAGL